ncbi:hypothetical protein [Enterocloster bolteae]|uniref:hypothetical protein n=1 Tax=Enterocloster bolteae TaxID=208479 RepID=UPI002910AE5F|nr:hypothetical protein [Enterocloster bolteae]MDU3287390.1 hypothetical protein [Enterocloster bolteae]
MKENNRNEYVREYIKETYKTVKVYIREEDYPAIIEHMKNKGYTKISGYIKDLIENDMNGTPGIQVKTNKGIVAGTIHGDISMK